MNILSSGLNYINSPLILFIVKILIFFSIVYFASYMTNFFVLKKRLKQSLMIIFFIGAQIIFYFLLVNITNVLILRNLLMLTVFLINVWIFIGRQLFPNHFSDFIICLFSIIFKISLIVIFIMHKVNIKDSYDIVIVILLGLIALIVTGYFFKQSWTKYLKIVLINKILGYIKTFKSTHSVLFENNLSVMLFSQSIFVLISIAFSVNSAVILKKVWLILKKQNIKENFNDINLLTLDNIIKSLQINMLVNKRSEKELKIIVNGYQRECLN